MSVIRTHQPTGNAEITSLGIVYGSLPSIGTISNYTGIWVSPNYLFFIQSHDKPIEQIMFNPSDSSSSWIRENLVNWVKEATQRLVAIATVLVAIAWIAIMTLVIYG